MSVTMILPKVLLLFIMFWVYCFCLFEIIFVKNCLGILMVFALNQWITFGKMAIFTVNPTDS